MQGDHASGGATNVAGTPPRRPDRGASPAARVVAQREARRPARDPPARP